MGHDSELTGFKRVPYDANIAKGHVSDDSNMKRPALATWTDTHVATDEKIVFNDSINTSEENSPLALSQI